MTQISPNSSKNDTNGNGRMPSSKTLQLEGGTAGNHALPVHNTGISEPGLLIPKAPFSDRKRHGFQWSSLRTKAAILAISLGTIPVLVTGGIGYYFANRGFTEQIATVKLDRAAGLEDKLKRFMRERYGDIQVISRRNFLTKAEFRDKISVEEKEASLDEIVENYKTYDLISVSDLKGNVILKSKSDPLPNQSDREYFQDVLKTDKPVITSAIIPRVSANPERPAINIAAPVKDSVTGKTIAIVRARLPVESLDELSKNFAASGDEYYVIDTAINKIFLGSQKSKEFKEPLPIFPGLSKLQAADKPNTLIFNDQAEKVEKLFGFTKFTKLEGLPDLPWQVIIAQPTRLAFEPQRQLLLAVSLGTLITAVLVSAIAIFVTNRTVRPILSAAGAVDKIGQGELETRLEIQGEDEIAELGSNINVMAEQLQTFVQEQTLAAERAFLLTKVTGSRALSSQELNNLFGEVVDDARKSLNVDRIVIYRFNPNGDGEIVSESVARGWPSALITKIDHSFVSEQQLEAYIEGSIQPINNILNANLAPEQLRVMERLEIRASVEVPILNEGRPYALLMAHHCETAHTWQSSEINFLQQLAAQMGLSLDRVLLLEQTEQLAQEQRQLKEGLQRRALDLLQEVDPISKGDLTIRAKVTADEIGTIADSYNATVGNLRKIVLQVQQAASQVAQTTSSNEASIQSLSTEALRQAEEIALALDRAQEMAQSVQLVAGNAEEALAAVVEASQTVEEGDQAMNRTVDGILAIRETVAETAKKVKHLGESSQKISTVVNLISTFAAQTNLLALNASIEAARAGEEGRGFAVVADEVRSLARQSAEATSEIEKLVAAIQGETNEVVAAMEAGTEQVVMGTKLVDETRQSLNKITTVSSKISDLVASITQATVVQSQASQAVTQTMTNVAAIAEKTSQEATFVSSSFEQLLKVAKALETEVGQFKVG
ncbi:methyl-accepting chemotaxis protein [Allocoleopsis franciscana]|uniref:Methyl-accepting chemotaxis protein n=1 Tax=Allocoleopsis franciscana PCC 7113 TaxID=1173027 RepID=K9WH22_9CYAN|nr:methyl-accepting chemotaxis protein [Allocoleopsis franciscana]AFZ19710.1 methyl-accepting chemotaxis protein [Allocoleopsis franciscana PCC 7113]